MIAFNKVNTSCFSPPLLPLDGDEAEKFHAQAFVVFGAWVASNMDMGARDCTSYEESMLQGAHNYFAKKLPDTIYDLPEPTLLDSFSALWPG
ncbi:hypothetical protein BST39_15800 [Mycobacterium paraseoulense]|uniref:Uncharacterized protein n=2 Tax=Mycobacterium paraseoulense TaxID=590652 RepID=A0A1X0I8U1_9MYCO|nr:hypothetical protein BST39_15800 [Mycobacterium paraseoulense]